MNKDLQDILWIVMMALSGGILLATVVPEILERKDS